MQGLLYPLDTIRTRLALAANGTYYGILHAAYRIRRDEGVAAFYRGMVPSMIGILPYAGVDIALFEILKEMLLDKYEGNPPHLYILTAGMISSSVAQVGGRGVGWGGVVEGLVHWYGGIGCGFWVALALELAGAN